MLSFPQILRRSLQLVGVILVVDGVIAYFMTLFNYSLIESLGDMILVEVAFLFIFAGLIDFRYSIGMAQVKKIVIGSNEDYSASKHRDSERRALVFVFTGLILFMILIVAAVYQLR
jgi:hypothetical protein